MKYCNYFSYTKELNGIYWECSSKIISKKPLTIRGLKIRLKKEDSNWKHSILRLESYSIE
jgi:hypothetical protein